MTSIQQYMCLAGMLNEPRLAMRPIGAVRYVLQALPRESTALQTYLPTPVASATPLPRCRLLLPTWASLANKDGGHYAGWGERPRREGGMAAA